MFVYTTSLVLNSINSKTNIGNYLIIVYDKYKNTRKILIFNIALYLFIGNLEVKHDGRIMNLWEMVFFGLLLFWINLMILDLFLGVCLEEIILFGLFCILYKLYSIDLFYNFYSILHGQLLHMYDWWTKRIKQRTTTNFNLGPKTEAYSKHQIDWLKKHYTCWADFNGKGLLQAWE